MNRHPELSHMPFEIETRLFTKRRTFNMHIHINIRVSFCLMYIFVCKGLDAVTPVYNFYWLYDGVSWIESLFWWWNGKINLVIFYSNHIAGRNLAQVRMKLNIKIGSLWKFATINRIKIKTTHKKVDPKFESLLFGYVSWNKALLRCRIWSILAPIQPCSVYRLKDRSP